MASNTQAPEKIFYSSDSLDVHSIFYTIQGEGPYCGKPAVFIRLAGCNLQCPGCDTEYTQGRLTMSIMDIVEEVELNPSFYWKPLIVITGGEPFRQNITSLCDKLLERGYIVQVESNGTLPPSPGLSYEVHVVCSPKTGSVNPKLFDYIDAYKYVLKSGDIDLDDGLPIHALDHSVKNRVARPHPKFNGPVYVQPMDEGNSISNSMNLQCVVKVCMNHGYRVQIQIHKILGVE